MLNNEKIAVKLKYARVIHAPRIMPAEYEDFPRNQLRICAIQLNKTDTTFGFDIVYGKDDIGTYVQEISTNSQASNNSLRRFDRTIEIDDEFMENETTEFVEEKLLKARAAISFEIFPSLFAVQSNIRLCTIL